MSTSVRPTTDQVERGYQREITGIIRSGIVTTQREISELEDSLRKRRAQLMALVSAAVANNIELLPGVPSGQAGGDALPETAAPPSLAGTGGGSARGGTG